MPTPSPDAACDHDWRLHKSWEETTYPPQPDPTRTTVAMVNPPMVTKHDEWYCTRCRLVEVKQRV